MEKENLKVTWIRKWRITWSVLFHNDGIRQYLNLVSEVFSICSCIPVWIRDSKGNACPSTFKMLLDFCFSEFSSHEWQAKDVFLLRKNEKAEELHIGFFSFLGYQEKRKKTRSFQIENSFVQSFLQENFLFDLNIEWSHNFYATSPNTVTTFYRRKKTRWNQTLGGLTGLNEADEIWIFIDALSMTDMLRKSIFIYSLCCT